MQRRMVCAWVCKQALHGRVVCAASLDPKTWVEGWHAEEAGHVVQDLEGGSRPDLGGSLPLQNRGRRILAKLAGFASIAPKTAGQMTSASVNERRTSPLG